MDFRLLKSQLLVLFVFIVVSVSAADRYWVATTSSNWNNTANWSASSGGPGGASVPGFSDVVYFDANSTGTCNLDINATVDAVVMSAGTFNTGSYTFTINGTTNNTFSGGTVNGSNTFNIHPTGATTRVTFSGTTFNPAVHVVAARILLNGSTFNGTSYFEKTGAGSDAGIGGNTFVGNCTIKNTGTSYFLLGNGGNDSFSSNLDIQSPGSGDIYLAYQTTTTSIGGDLSISQTDTAGNVGICNYADATLNISGNCTLTNNSTTASSLFFVRGGTATISGDLSITNGGTGNSDIILANSTGSSLSITGTTTVVNNDSATTHRIHLGSHGNVTFSGDLLIKNNSKANNSQIYCNNGTGSTNTYNGNIVVEVTQSGSDGIYFGNSGGQGTLAASKTITVGTNGYISGYLTLRNFTQTGSTAQSFTLTGTSILNIYNSSWGGNVDFTSPRVLTRGSTYSGTCRLVKTGGGSDLCYGDNTFTGNTELSNSGSGYLMMGYGGTDDFQANLTLNNTGSNNFYIAGHSPGTTNINGDFTINNTAAASNGLVYVSRDSISSVVIAGNTVVTNSGAGTTKRVYLGYNGDVTFNGSLTIHNSSTANNSQVYLNNSPDCSNTYNGNIIIESSNTATDGIYFGYNDGHGTLASGYTITVGSAGFSGGRLYMRNFTQSGTTAQSLTLANTAILTNYNSNWGGNVSFTAGGMITRGTTYNGTAFLEKTGTGNNNSFGGNVFKGDTEIKNSGSGQLIMGNGSADDFQANLVLRNTGSSNIYLANNSAGNQIAGNLDIYNSGPNIVINNNSASTISIGGNCTISESGSATLGRVYFNDDGTLSLGGTLDISVTASGNAYVYVSTAGTSSTSITGATTVTNSGTGSISVVYLGNGGDVTFNNTLTIHNNSAANSSGVYLNDDNGTSHNDYNDNIIVESTVANCDGVLFGYGGGSGTLAAGKTITIGSGGFVSGQLYLRNFTQLGSTAQTLTATGTGTIYNYDSEWGGNVVFTAPTFITRGTTYHGTAFLEKTGSTNDAGAGGNTFDLAVTFKNSGTGSLTLGNGTADTFSSDVTLENVGSNDIVFARGGTGHSIAGDFTINNIGSDGDIYVCDYASSGLSISGNTSVVNSGAGSNHRIYLGNRGDISFGGTLDISNSCTATNSAIYLNSANGSDNTYAANISIENTNSASDGILFGNSGGTGVLAAGQTISIKSGGFIAGQLRFRNFTQTGPTAQSLTLTGTALLSNISSDWGGNVNFVSPRMLAWGTTFRGTAYLEKSGSGNDNSTGGNTFMGNTQIVNSGSGYLYLGSGTATDFQANLTLNNTVTNNLYVARDGSGHNISGNLVINNTGAGTQVSIANQSAATLTIGGTTTVQNSGGGTNHRVYLGNDGDVTFNGDIDISNSSDATNSAVYIGENTTNSQITMNGNLSVEVTNASNDGIYILPQAATMASGKTISLKSGGFIAGRFNIVNFTQLGTAAVTLNLTGSARLDNFNCNFGGNVHFTSPRIFLRESTYNGTAYIEKTGGGDDQSYGGNTFKENTHIVNSSSGNYFVMAGTLGDTFEKDLLFENTGGDDLFLGNSSSASSIQGNLTVNNTARSVFFANGNGSSLSITGTTTINNNSALATSAICFGQHGSITASGTCTITNNATGASGQIFIANSSSSSITMNAVNITNQNGGTTKRVYLGNAGDITINGALDISNTATATNSQVYCVQSSNSTGTFNGNISVSASGTDCDGIFFGNGGGLPTLAGGHTISVGAGGFSDGQLYLRNFTQSGSATINLNLTNVGYLYLYNSSWDATLNFVAPRVYMRENTFNTTTSIEKSGSTDINSYGQNIFNGNTTITSSGSGYFRLAYNAPNDYNADLTYVKSGSGNFFPAYNQHCTLAGNLNVNTNSALIIANGTNGWLEFDGTAAQSINNTGAANTITIRHMMTNNSAADITLNTPVTVSGNLNLTNGNIITTSTNILTMTDNAAVDAVSDNAYVAGPMVKIGNDAFTFPVGGTDAYGDSHYAAIGISAPSAATHSFTAEYHAAAHANATTFSAPLTKVSLVEYWDLSRNVGSGNINVYLYWTDGTRSGIGNFSDLRVAHWNGSTWEDLGNDGTSGTSASGGVAANGVSSFSPFTFGTVDNVQNPLPIELLSFDVTKLDDAVRIDWQTASETNNDYFIVERTADFEHIETLQTIKGAGNSNEVLDYSVLDSKPLQGTSYYRLVQVDYNGQREIFDWKAVRFDQTYEPALSVFPNPSTNGNFNVELQNIKGATELQLFDISGRIVYRESLDLMENNNRIVLNRDLNPGVYFVRIINGDLVLSKRLIVK